MRTLLIEKTNQKFKANLGTNQNSGLSVCLGMIKQSIKGVLVQTCENLYQVECAINQHRPSKVVFEALWVNASDIGKLRVKFPKVRFYVHIHSNIPFLAIEAFAIQKIKDYQHHGAKIIFNCKRAHLAFPDSLYLPNIYSVDYEPIIERQETDTLDIVCAGSIRPMKNHLIQAMAALKYAEKFGKKLRFHVNMKRSEGGDEIKTNLMSLFTGENKLVAIPWLEHKKFIQYLQGMDFGLQVSMTESFNIVAADYVAAGIPMVVSEEIEWAASNCKVFDSGSVQSIYSAMLRYHLLKEGSSLIEQNRTLLSHFTKDAINRWVIFNEA